MDTRQDTVRAPKPGSAMDKAANAATVVMALCVLTLTILVARRHLSAEAPSNNVAFTTDTVENWAAMIADGRPLGSQNAPVQIVEFVDLECPACAALTPVIQRLKARYHDKVAVTYRHFPLPAHPHSDSAAVAAECAADQGHFGEFVEAVLGGQRQLGVQPWRGFAAQANVPNLAKFDACLRGRRPLRIEQDQEIGRRAEVHGTPTLVINGRRLSPPGGTGLQEHVEASIRQAEQRQRRK